MFSLPTAQDDRQFSPLALGPLSVWVTSSQDIGNKEPPHDGGWNPAAAAKLHQSCPTLCDPIDGSPPGSPVPGILQARTLEWVAISFSNAWKWKVKVKSLSRVRLSDPIDCSPPGSSVHGIFQARVLGWGTTAFSSGWNEVDQKIKDKILLHCLAFQEIESQSTKITQH